MLQKVLSEGGTFPFYPRGSSMLPWIREGKDRVLLAPLPDELKKNQIVLYKRKNGAYVLHRIVKIQGDTYTMRGDHQYVNEPGISREQMLGVVSRICREDREYRTEQPLVRFQALLWTESAGLRRLLSRILHRFFRNT